MGPARLLVLVLLAAHAGGCANTPSSGVDLTPAASAPADLDSLAYGRGADEAKAAHAAVMGNPRIAGAAAPVVATAAAASRPAAAEAEEPYRIDSGDRLRIVVFGQEGLTNSYLVDSSGAITMPLIKTMATRGLSTDELTRAVADRLRRGFMREPHVAIEVESYRPFFILGEVIFPGQYAYVPHMTVENAIAIAGGFTPRAYRWGVKLDRPVPGGILRDTVPPLARVRPGDTLIVTERWL